MASWAASVQLRKSSKTHGKMHMFAFWVDPAATTGGLWAAKNASCQNIWFFSAQTPPVVVPGSAQKAKMCILLCVFDDFRSCTEAAQEAIQRHHGRRPGAQMSHPRGYLGRPLRPKHEFYYVFLHFFCKMWTLFFENRMMSLAFASLLES